MGFELSDEDGNKLDEVHPDLRRVIYRAAAISPFQFYISCGARSVEEQKVNVKKGVSKTMASRHITSEDGYAYAVDLIPEYNGAWEHENWEAYYPLGELVCKAARLENVPIEWGAVWDRKLNNMQGSAKEEVAAYVKRQRARKPGKSVFLDGPHFQLPRAMYPGNASREIEEVMRNDNEMAAVATESPPIVSKEPKVITVVKEELRESGSNTIKEGDRISSIGKTTVGIGTGITVGQTSGLFDKLGEWTSQISTSKYLISSITKLIEFAFSKWYIFMIVFGLFVWQAGFRVKFFRAQDAIKGKDTGRRE